MTAKQLAANAYQGIQRLAVSAADGTLDRIHKFTKDLPSTNWLILCGTFLAIATGLVYLTSIFLSKPPELQTFLAWLAFLASMMGFGVRQFRVKRETDANLSPAARSAASARLSGKQEVPTT